MSVSVRLGVGWFGITCLLPSVETRPTVARLQLGVVRRTGLAMPDGSTHPRGEEEAQHRRNNPNRHRERYPVPVVAAITRAMLTLQTAGISTTERESSLLVRLRLSSSSAHLRLCRGR